MPGRDALPTLSLGLDAAARGFAAMPRDEAETMIDLQVANAIREWRVSDATVWQRIKFRSRMMRSTGAHRADGIGKA